MRRHTAARDRAFNSLGLYWEHDWTADGPISRGQRAAWQELQAAEVEAYVNSVYAEAALRLGGMINRPENSTRFFMLNPLGWPRTDFADFPYSGSPDIHVCDVVSQKDVPHQLVQLSGAKRLRILASDVPAAGYKVYEILPGPGTASTDDAAAISGDDKRIIENTAVKLVVNREGVVRSFIDKLHGNVELAGDHKMNEIAAGLEEGAALEVENRGPVSVTLRPGARPVWPTPPPSRSTATPIALTS